MASRVAICLRKSQFATLRCGCQLLSAVVTGLFIDSGVGSRVGPSVVTVDVLDGMTVLCTCKIKSSNYQCRSQGEITACQI